MLDTPAAADLDFCLTALEMAQLIKSREVAPDYFVKAAQDRIAALNPHLNAVVHPCVPQMPPNLDGPFAGVPLLLKDTGAAIKGMALTSGSRLYAGVIGAADSSYGARLRQAGFAFIGRTNTPELALSFTTEGSYHGAARNPWDLTRSPGGSSGGAAAVVAAGIVPIAQASDGAGSIRVPAAHCGVFGLKPSRLRNPSGPDVAEGIGGMATLNGLSRSVADSAAFLDATHGADIGDPWGVPSPAPDGGFLRASRQAPPKLRIGLQLSGSAEIQEAVERAAKLCVNLGHEVEVGAPAYDNAALGRAWFTIAAVNCARGFARRADSIGRAQALGLLEPVNAEWIERGAQISATDYLGAIQCLHATSRAMGQFFARYDIYMSPVSAEVAPPLGALAGLGHSPETFFDQFWAHAPLTAVFNASGCPAMSLPLAQSAEGLPIGVHFGAAFGAEALLFQLAGQIEASAPWADRRPSLSFLAKS